MLEADGIQYEYDPEGNLIKKIERNGSIWKYEWSGTGLLSKVIRPDNAEVTFLYDALGRRIAKTYRGQRTRWIWDGNVILHEWAETYKQNPFQKNKSDRESGQVKIQQRDQLLVTEPANAPPLEPEALLADFTPSRDDLTTWVLSQVVLPQLPN